MKTFKEYLEENKVKRGSPDISGARSLAKQAVERLADLKSLPLKSSNASFRFESAYECLREAIQSFMAKKGFKPYSHEAVIVFAQENGLLNEKEVRNLDRYREKRNDINYRAQKIEVEEAKEIIIFAKEVVLRLEKRFIHENN